MQKMNNSGPSSKLCTQLKCEEKFSNKKACITVRNGTERMERKRGGSNKKCCTCGLLLATVCPSGQTMPDQGKWSLGAYADKRRGAPHNRPKRFPLNRIAWEGIPMKKNKAYAFVKIFSIFLSSHKCIFQDFFQWSKSFLSIQTENLSHFFTRNLFQFYYCYHYSLIFRYLFIFYFIFIPL